MNDATVPAPASPADSAAAPPAGLRFGLAASRLHRSGPHSGLAVWLDRSAAALRELDLGLVAVGRSFEWLAAHPALQGYGGIAAGPSGRAGGLMRLVSRIAGGLRPEEALDGAIYLVDPVDPSSLYPEALALKRQCVTHQKPYIATVAGAIEWIEIERRLAGLPHDGRIASLQIDRQTLALIAHDALKDRMVDFAAAHFDLLCRFSARVATGTTGQRLNELARTRGWPAGDAWVRPYLSGPLGGDAQIAELVLDRRCGRVVFFEDPHVARQHEADIQLLDRAVCSMTREAVCLNSPAMAVRWARALEAPPAAAPY